jgi:hypothetical protein
LCGFPDHEIAAHFLKTEADRAFQAVSKLDGRILRAESPAIGLATEAIGIRCSPFCAGPRVDWSFVFRMWRACSTLDVGPAARAWVNKLPLLQPLERRTIQL